MLPGFRLEWPITDSLVELRAGVRAFGAGAELDDRRLMDLVIVASEGAGRVLEQGGGGAVVAWSDAGGVSLEIVDVSGMLAVPYRTVHASPVPLDRQGIGFWLMHRLCDEVSLDEGDGTARLHLRFRHRARQAGEQLVRA
ncbi:ATP-binding protein [Nonomuraea sp. NPDC050404]|uniref:ATP-binding protein n=1 Tax=Nonomuraea sp. NPDC050404 TaxID=3155783 RepID=UPI0034017E51